MTLRFILIILFAVLWSKINTRLYADYLSPFQILFVSWVFPLSLRTMQLSKLEMQWEFESICIIFWVTLCLLLPSLLPYFLMRTKASNPSRIIFSSTLKIVSSSIFKMITLFLFVISFSAYLFSEFVTNPAGIPLVSAITGNMPLGGDWHRWGKETKWSLITPLLFILTPMLYLIYKSTLNISKRRLYLFLALLFPVMGILKLSRSDMFIGGLNIAFVEYYWRKAMCADKCPRRIINYKNVLLVLLFLLSVFGTLYARIGMSRQGNIYSKMIGFKLDGEGFFVDVFAQIYGYLALPFENFHIFFETYNGGLNFGISAFRPLLSMFGQGSVANEMLAMVDYVPLSDAAGSATFLTFIYAELGICGLFIIPLLYALLINMLYLRFRAKPSFVNMFSYMNFVYPWFWLFFNNAFSVLTFYINFAFIIIIVISCNVLNTPISAKYTADKLAKFRI